MNFFDTPISLSKLRDELVRMEDTIIFALVERSLFSQNTIIYKHKGFEFSDYDGSFLEYFLHETECVHAKVRRYTSPDEYPFTANLPEPILPPLAFPKLLIPNDINVNQQLVELYTSKIVPLICVDGDDGNYGSSATKDVEALQILSRRIHMGKYVAEAKFNDPAQHDQYVALIKAQDRDGLMALLTNAAVEERLLRRVEKKAMIYGQEIDDSDKPSTGHLRLPLKLVSDLYEEHIIPLTKQVEVDYLLQRLNYPDFTPEVPYTH
ncbi:chorismate mutase [Polychytrium aggregatum]|uniref:chorismate mutase n=1 Tax=Polychytrium aggregatum TaxID=110093 RepID=UPI0022FEB5CF|nr:chorismate mutase [Polychytrium aggregatum]KAI9202240.1 chorismate mutase [Polychytrium aggregatum]